MYVFFYLSVLNVQLCILLNPNSSTVPATKKKINSIPDEMSMCVLEEVFGKVLKKKKNPRTILHGTTVQKWPSTQSFNIRKLITACFQVSSWMLNEIQVLASCNTPEEPCPPFISSCFCTQTHPSLSLWNQPTTGIILPFIPLERHGLATSWWVAAAAHPAHPGTQRQCSDFTHQHLFHFNHLPW